MSKAEDPKSCKDFRDDYLECLHHRKEVRLWQGGCGPQEDGCSAARLLLLLLHIVQHVWPYRAPIGQQV